MKYEIKQINNTDAVVISDEEIKEKDNCINLAYNLIVQPTDKNWANSNSDNFKKIIATISPFKIEGLPMLELPNPAYDWFTSKSYLEQHSLSDKYFESKNPSLLTNEQVTEMYKLELPNQEEDIDRLANDLLIDKYGVFSSNQIVVKTGKAAFKDGFKEGYKAAQKQYSEEDMKIAIEMARGIKEGKKTFTAEGISGCTEICTYDWTYEYEEGEILQSLQTKQFPIAVELTEDLQIIKWYYE